MARKKSAPTDPDNPNAAPPEAVSGPMLVRFPVTAEVFAELSKYGAVRKLTQNQVAEELAPDLLALFRGELHAAAAHDDAGAASEFKPVGSLRQRALAALEKAW